MYILKFRMQFYQQMIWFLAEIFLMMDKIIKILMEFNNKILEKILIH
jgi:hypothetical protein